MKTAVAVLLSSVLLSAQAPPPAEPSPAPARPAVEPGPGSKPGAPTQQPGQQTRQPAQEPAQQPAQPAAGQQGPKTGAGPDKNGGAGATGTQEPRIDRPDESQPVPRGADPADLAAIRSAEAMIAAERRLQQMIKDGKITGLDQVVTFDELSAWPYEDGLKGMPRQVKELDGKKVLMSGFMLPIDEVQNIKEFLLVQSLWSCCYGQPPDINGIVRVVMPKDRTTDYFFDPLKIIGNFKVEATVIDGYCVDIYQLEVESLEALK